MAAAVAIHVPFIYSEVTESSSISEFDSEAGLRLEAGYVGLKNFGC
jgi:hypothetical protein